MLNPLKVYALAADARRAEAILRGRFYGGNWSLPTMAKNAVTRVEELEQSCLTYCDQLAAANAKIARMTSGLKRGSKSATLNRDGTVG